MSQFESVFDPLNSLFATDYSDPQSFLAGLKARAQTPQSSGGRRKKPKPLVDQVPPGLSSSSTAPKAPAPAQAAAPATGAVDPERARFIASLAPHVKARTQAADNPLSLKRAAEWEANQIAGYDARQQRDARAERQRASLIEQGKKNKAQREANRQYRANLSNEIYESEKYGEQNPAQPTGPVVDPGPVQWGSMDPAANRAAVKADNDVIMALNAARREEERQKEMLFGYDKAEAARLRGAGERAAAATAATKAQVESTLLPRDVNSLIAKTPTGQLASLATPMEGNVTTPLNPQPISNQFVQPAPGLLDMNRMAERELFDKQMADAEQEKKIRAIVEGTMANYNAGRNTSPAPALGQRNPEAEAMAARAPRIPTSQIPFGVPTMGGADAEQVAFNQKVQELMARGFSNQEAIRIARGENQSIYDRAQQNARADPNIAAYDPQGLNTMSALDVVAGEGAMGLGAKGLRAAGILKTPAPRAAASAPVDTPMVPQVRSAPAQPNRFTPTTPEETALQADLQGIRPFDAGSAAARRSQMADADRLRNRIREMGADPEVVTGPTNVAGDAFSQAVDARRVPPALDMPPPARRRPDRLSPESIESAQKEGMLFDIGAPGAPPKAPAATATETATAIKSAPKGQMTFDQLYEAPKPAAPGAPAPSKASRLASLPPEAQQRELAKAYDRAFSELRGGRLSQAEFDQIVANTLKGEYGGVFNKVLESQSFSRVKEAKSAVEGALGTKTWRDKITDPLWGLL